MAVRVTVRLDRPGIAELAKSAMMETFIGDVALDVAINVGAQGLTAATGASESAAAIVGEVEGYTTDRAAALVTIKHPAGLGMQAKYGVLTKACSAAGLELKS